MSTAIQHPPTKECLQRLKKEFVEISKHPIDNVLVCPHKDNILEWHYVLLGSINSPYEGGVYYGQLTFNYDFPLSPPSIIMTTPSGRFETNKRICLSNSDYHKETWVPSWTVGGILIGLLSFMNENEPTAGSITTTNDEKRLLASKSLEYNKKNKTFCDLFPYLLD